jgi:acetoin:2,6-dichlorophenolindophenol oxidoreductase subunit alpha
VNTRTIRGGSDAGRVSGGVVECGFADWLTRRGRSAMREQASREQGMELLRKMLLIRRFEEKLVELFERGLVVGHYHVYIGQEATGVAAIARLEPRDVLFTTHRNHGHLLGRGADPVRLMAEILGRATGLNGGRSGTLHPVAPAQGIIHTSAIVAGCLPLAAGAAFTAKHTGSGQVAVVFFGDGAMEEGAFYEVINLAGLWTLPLVLVCENNSVTPEKRAAGQYPSSTHVSKQLVDVPRSFNMPASVVDGADPEAVSAGVGEAIARARRGEGPSFIEARTSRWPGNYPLFPQIVGGTSEVCWAWEPDTVPAELQAWSQSSDPILLWIQQLLARRAATQREVLDLDGETRRFVQRIADEAVAAPWPNPSSAHQGVLA